uniref:Baculoviral IAP repeat-containing protein 5.2-like n=2 Tax=Dermatophagoides pteronyssinus TaxID=6956 RepID=A0A6P6XP49_DERPT|nr:baculoviral IAP repeat-containing protein 5.2-like [Dermatophagoides pteronyssinus]
MCHNNVTIFLKAKTNFLDQRINTMSSSDNNNNNDENDNRMYSENNRLKSFTNWPHNSENISKKEMAKHGFYQLHGHDNNDDLVRCVFCDIHMSGWQSKDDPNVEHQKASPDCLFAKLQKSQMDLTLEEFMTIIYEKNNIKIKRYRETIRENLSENIEKLLAVVEKV